MDSIGVKNTISSLTGYDMTSNINPVSNSMDNIGEKNSCVATENPIKSTEVSHTWRITNKNCFMILELTMKISICKLLCSVVIRTAIWFIRIVEFNYIDDYVDDFLGFGVPRVAKRFLDALYDTIQKLGPCISSKKLIHPGSQDVYLEVLVDIVAGTVSIPPERIG